MALSLVALVKSLLPFLLEVSSFLWELTSHLTANDEDLAALNKNEAVGLGHTAILVSGR